MSALSDFYFHIVLPRPIGMWLWIVLLIQGSVGISADNLQATLSPKSIGPGDFSVLTITSPPPDRILGASVCLRGESFQGYRLGDAWKAIIAVRALAPPGKYPVSITVVDEEGHQKAQTLSLRVHPKTFPIQKIKVAPAKGKLMSKEILNREREILIQAMRESVDMPLWEGKFALPVSGRVTSDFGKKRYLNGRLWGQHSGLDLSARMGTPVLAPSGGRVAYTGKLWMRGNTLILDHGFGVFSLFNHLSAFVTQPGDVVQTGQAVARTGATGLVNGPHLHWEVRIGTVPVNPWPLIREGLPLTPG